MFIRVVKEKPHQTFWPAQSFFHALLFLLHLQLFSLEPNPIKLFLFSTNPTETASLKVTNNLHIVQSKSQFSVLIYLTH